MSIKAASKSGRCSCLKVAGLALNQFNIVAMDADEKSGNRYIDEGVSKAIDLIQQHE